MQVAELNLKDKFRLYMLSVCIASVGFVVLLFKFPIVAKIFVDAFFGLLIGLLVLCAVVLVIGFVAKMFWLSFEAMWGTKECPFSWKQRGIRFLFVVMVWFGVAFGLMGIGAPWWLAWLVPFAMFCVVSGCLDDAENNKRQELKVEVNG